MDNMKSVSEAKCFLRCFPLFEGCFEGVREKLLLLFFLLVTPHALLMVKTNERKHANQQGLNWWISLLSSKCFSASDKINADTSLKENEKQNIEENKKECLQSVEQLHAPKFLFPPQHLA